MWSVYFSAFFGLACLVSVDGAAAGVVVGAVVTGFWSGFSSPSLIGFIAGKRSTSLILFELVKNIVKRSIPTPQPPVGGKPYSKAVQKFSSTAWASSSPAALSFIVFHF